MKLDHCSGSVLIYALCDEDGAVRYVGKTRMSLRKRIAAHLSAARRGVKKHVNAWLLSLLKIECVPVVRLLEVADDRNWQERERYWIMVFRQSGAKLCNLTDGGDGLTGLRLTDQHRKRIALSLRKGKQFSCEVCGSAFWRKPSAIKNGDNKFCSRQCYFVWQRGKAKPVALWIGERGRAVIAEKRAIKCS